MFHRNKGRRPGFWAGALIHDGKRVLLVMEPNKAGGGRIYLKFPGETGENNETTTDTLQHGMLEELGLDISREAMSVYFLARLKEEVYEKFLYAVQVPPETLSDFDGLIFRKGAAEEMHLWVIPLADLAGFAPDILPEHKLFIKKLADMFASPGNTTQAA